jgi:hypothetical protein
MSFFHWSPFDHADEYKLAAKRDRERGGSTIRVYATTAQMHLREDREASPWQRLSSVVRFGYRDACLEAQQDFAWTAHGLGDEMIPDPFGPPATLEQLRQQWGF